MSDEKPKPVDDLKQGLGLLFRAAKGAVERLPTDRLEGAVKDGAKEVGRAFESVASELDKAFSKATGSEPPARPEASAPHAGPQPSASAGATPPAEQEPATAPKYDDAYAPEPPPGPRGPRVG
jgi:hypothetical protein